MMQGIIVSSRIQKGNNGDDIREDGSFKCQTELWVTAAGGGRSA